MTQKFRQRRFQWGNFKDELFELKIQLCSILNYLKEIKGNFTVLPGHYELKLVEYIIVNTLLNLEVSIEVEFWKVWGRIR